jgi:hypothetical protein
MDHRHQVGDVAAIGRAGAVARPADDPAGAAFISGQ